MEGYSYDQLPDNLKQAPRDVFAYAINVASIAAGATPPPISLNFEASSTFIWMGGFYMADIAGAAQTSDSQVLPLVNVSIMDTGASRSMMNGPIPVSTMFGPAGVPFIMPTPRVIMASSTLQFTISNYSAATTYTNLFLVMQGIKIFAASPR